MDDTGDLTRTPWPTPAARSAGPRLVVGDRAHTVRPRRARGLAGAPEAASAATSRGGGADSLDRTLRRLGAAPLAERTPLLAVGSNAAASVVRHKLARRGVGIVVPLLTGVVRHLAVGHTAYVSRGGYVPAAPVHRSRARTPVVLQLLDDDQLAAIDATEPGYDRVELSSTRYPLLALGRLAPRPASTSTRPAEASWTSPGTAAASWPSPRCCVHSATRDSRTPTTTSPRPSPPRSRSRPRAARTCAADSPSVRWRPRPASSPVPRDGCAGRRSSGRRAQGGARGADEGGEEVGGLRLLGVPLHGEAEAAGPVLHRLEGAVLVPGRGDPPGPAQ